MKAVEIYRLVEQSIATRQLKAGDRLPTVREAAEHWNVNKNTVVAAYGLLQKAGLIYSAGRNGSIVSGPVVPNAAPRGAAAPAASGVTALDAGNPDRSFLPNGALLRTHLMQLSTDVRLYGEPSGAEGLLEWASEKFAADGVRPGELFVGSGAMDVMGLAARTNLSAGDAVAIEDPAYATTIGLLRSLGFKPVPMALDAEGVVPQALAGALAAGCKAVVLSSRAQNPTGVCTSAGRAAQLKSIVQSAPGVLFIDDDHSSLLDLAPYHPFIAEAAERWLVVRSVSKFLGPDLRVAVAAGDNLTTGRLERAQAYAMGWVSSLLQRLAANLLRDATVSALTRQAGEAYRARFRFVKDHLAGYGIETLGSAGINIWVPCMNEAPVVQSLMSKGWRIRTGADFTLSAAPGFRVTTAALAGALAERFVLDLRDTLEGASALRLA